MSSLYKQLSFLFMGPEYDKETREKYDKMTLGDHIKKVEILCGGSPFENDKAFTSMIAIIEMKYDIGIVLKPVIRDTGHMEIEMIVSYEGCLDNLTVFTAPYVETLHYCVIANLSVFILKIIADERGKTIDLPDCFREINPDFATSLGYLCLCRTCADMDIKQYCSGFSKMKVDSDTTTYQRNDPPKNMNSLSEEDSRPFINKIKYSLDNLKDIPSELFEL